MCKPKSAIKIMFLLICTLSVFVVLNGCKGEHPTARSQGGNSNSVTKDELADAIEAYINEKSAQSDGYFVVADDKAGELLKLSLVKVHRKRLSRVGDNLYFACADFVTPEGKMYDLDVFMEGTEKDNLTFSEFSVHKEAGKERYTWVEENGVWKKKPLGGDEHPTEHPNEQTSEDPIEHPNGLPVYD